MEDPNAAMGEHIQLVRRVVMPMGTSIKNPIVRIIHAGKGSGGGRQHVLSLPLRPPPLQQEQPYGGDDSHNNGTILLLEMGDALEAPTRLMLVDIPQTSDDKQKLMHRNRSPTPSSSTPTVEATGDGVVGETTTQITMSSPDKITIQVLPWTGYIADVQVVRRGVDFSPLQEEGVDGIMGAYHSEEHDYGDEQDVVKSHSTDLRLIAWAEEDCLEEIDLLARRWREGEGGNSTTTTTLLDDDAHAVLVLVEGGRCYIYPLQRPPIPKSTSVVTDRHQHPRIDLQQNLPPPVPLVLGLARHAKGNLSAATLCGRGGPGNAPEAITQTTTTTTEADVFRCLGGISGIRAAYQGQNPGHHRQHHGDHHQYLHHHHYRPQQYSGKAESGGDCLAFTGHENGSLLVWDVSGAQLRYLGALTVEPLPPGGPPFPSPTHAVTTIHVVEEVGLVLAGLSSGEIRIFTWNDIEHVALTSDECSPKHHHDHHEQLRHRVTLFTRTGIMDAEVETPRSFSPGWICTCRIMQVSSPVTCLTACVELGVAVAGFQNGLILVLDLFQHRVVVVTRPAVEPAIDFEVNPDDGHGHDDDEDDNDGDRHRRRHHHHHPRIVDQQHQQVYSAPATMEVAPIVSLRIGAVSVDLVEDPRPAVTFLAENGIVGCLDLDTGATLAPPIAIRRERAGPDQVKNAVSLALLRVDGLPYTRSVEDPVLWGPRGTMRVTYQPTSGGGRLVRKETLPHPTSATATTNIATATSHVNDDDLSRADVGVDFERNYAVDEDVHVDEVISLMSRVADQYRIRSRLALLGSQRGGVVAASFMVVFGVEYTSLHMVQEILEGRAYPIGEARVQNTRSAAIGVDPNLGPVAILLSMGLDLDRVVNEEHDTLVDGRGGGALVRLGIPGLEVLSRGGHEAGPVGDRRGTGEKSSHPPGLTLGPLVGRDWRFGEGHRQTEKVARIACCTDDASLFLVGSAAGDMAWVRIGANPHPHSHPHPVGVPTAGLTGTSTSTSTSTKIPRMDSLVELYPRVVIAESIPWSSRVCSGGGGMNGDTDHSTDSTSSTGILSRSLRVGLGAPRWAPSDEDEDEIDDELRERRARHRDQSRRLITTGGGRRGRPVPERPPPNSHVRASATPAATTGSLGKSVADKVGKVGKAFSSLFARTGSGGGGGGNAAGGGGGAHVVTSGPPIPRPGPRNESGPGSRSRGTMADPAGHAHPPSAATTPISTTSVSASASEVEAIKARYGFETKTTARQMEDNRRRMEERAERIAGMRDKSEQMQSEASDFASLAAELNHSMGMGKKKKGLFGFF